MKLVTVRGRPSADDGERALRKLEMDLVWNFVVWRVPA